MSSSVVVSPAPDGDNGNPQGHCSRCHRVWTLKTRQGVCPWCNKPANCITATSKPRQFKPRSNGHKRQAMGAVMSHLGARVFTVLREDRPYKLRDTDGNTISKGDARRLIMSKYQVPEEIRHERRRRNRKASNTVGASRKGREMVTYRTNEAAAARFDELVSPRRENEPVEKAG